MMPVALASTSAVAYGISDYLGGVASRRARVLRVVSVSYPLSIVLVGVAALVAGGSPTGVGLGWGLASGLASGVAVWSFYLALSRGPMSVISPITAVLAAAVPLAFGLAAGERPAPAAGAGMALALVATVLVSMESRDGSSALHGRLTRRLLVLTVFSGLAFAAFFVLLAQVPPGQGLWPVAASRIGATVMLLVAAVAARESFRFSRRLIAIGVVIAVFDAVANAAFYFASQAGMLSLVSVIAALYPAFTVALAIAHGGERMRAVQMVGLVLAGVAISLLALG
ncbi:EamA-like transporter family protein [Dietzia kunjamensis subsp. schimae]|uniref:EamA-like transporter family protein n=1 Tax=Dietzia kunjamensis subsp. schimae TaxID=498198 RepID=A0ABY1N2M0_9ACTN|nr:EamA family transporter [Dietzia kunjamensis]MBB1013990.1 EamA family transporter [Dietzia kunjamensis subsp. schimae]SMO75015.1 EamA-like transporter family protein [Dietzia kunjamensis subsp. schimae]